MTSDQTSSRPDRFSLTELGQISVGVGRRTPVYGTPVGCGKCVVDTCTSLAFVSIRTTRGTKGLCFRRFEALRDQTPAPATSRRRTS